MSINHIRTIEFWEWFKSISDELLSNPNEVNLINQLDKHVRSLGNFDWEIGPYHESTFYLAISPHLNKELLNETKAIIDLSKRCSGWSFLHAKPEKGWIGNWRMFNENNKTIEIDANPWEYILYQFEDGIFDIKVKVNNIDGNIDVCHLAVEIAITNLLGEEKYMTLFNKLDITNDIITNGSNWSLLENLGKHITHLTKNQN